MQMKKAERGISRRDVLASAIGGSLMMAYPHASAQDPAPNFPSRPLRLIVPYAAGGTPDAVTRLVADGLSKALQQPVIVDNRGGAGGRLGVDVASKATADGYTLLLADAGPIVIAPLLNDVPYDPQKDFTPVDVVVTSVFAVAVPTSLGVSTIAEFVALAKSKPGKFNYGTGGDIHQLMVEAFKAEAGIDLVHVSYKGAPQAVLALISGDVSLVFAGPGSMLPFVKSGGLKILAITSSRRSKQYPDIPTLAELGYPGTTFQGDMGIFVPVGTPPGIVAKLNAALNKTIAQPEIGKRMEFMSVEPMGMSPQAAAAHWEAEKSKFAKAIKVAGLRKEGK